MKKKILSIAMVALSLVAFNGMAQTANPASSVQTEKVRGERADKKGQRDAKKGERAPKNPYEGLTLSEAQKTQLQQLDAKRAEARKQMKAEAKEKKAAAKEQKQQLTAEQKAQQKTARMEARKAAKMQYLQEVKAIVGPEQYVVFLENMYVNGGGHQKAKGMKKGSDRKGGKQMAQGKSSRKGGKEMAHNGSSKKGSKQGAQKNGKQRQANSATRA